MAINSNIKQLLDIANSVKDENLKAGSKERIPTSETFIKKMVTTFGKTVDEVKDSLEILTEVHYIFIITLVQPDPTLFVQGVESYVFADVSILNELKHYTEQRLSQEYERTYYKRKTAFQITRELYPRLKEFNNTQLGRCLNEAVAVEEFIRVITQNAFEYTDSWRKEKLYKMTRSEDDFYTGQEYYDDIDISVPNESGRPREAGNSKWAKAVNAFSIPFLIRIHFRKYEFDVIRKLLVTGKINRMEDLLFIRNSIRDLEKQIDKDTILKYHTEKMTELRRLAQAKINILRKDEQDKISSN